MNIARKQSGSIHLVIIIAVIVVIIAAIGFVVWKNLINKPTTSVKQAQTTSYASEKTFVSDFYSQYITLGDSMNGVDGAKENALRTTYRVTTNSDSNAFDAVVCGQDFPQTIKVSDGTKTTDGIAFDIEELWGESSSHVSATVSSDSKGMKINVAACSF